jgi:hypothetical protein
VVLVIGFGCCNELVLCEVMFRSTGMVTLLATTVAFLRLGTKQKVVLLRYQALELKVNFTRYLRAYPEIAISWKENYKTYNCDSRIQRSKYLNDVLRLPGNTLT